MVIKLSNNIVYIKLIFITPNTEIIKIHTCKHTNELFNTTRTYLYDIHFKEKIYLRHVFKLLKY